MKWRYQSPSRLSRSQAFLAQPDYAACRAVLLGDYPALEAVAKKAINEKQPFERCVIKKEDLLKMFEVWRF